MLWFTMLDIERDMMLALFLLGLRLMTGLAALLMIRDIAGCWVIYIPWWSAADIYQDTLHAQKREGFSFRSCLVRTLVRDRVRFS